MAEPLTGTISSWSFDQRAGPVINTLDTRGRDALSAGSGNHGWVGYLRDDSDDRSVGRDGSKAVFNGERNSIIFIDDATHADFNPAAGSLTTIVRFTVDESVLTERGLGPNQTWNLVQKGRFNNAGGQWKLQIRKNHAGKILFQCLVNDDRPDTPRELTEVAIDRAWITDADVLEGRCALDRRAGELRADLTNPARDVAVRRKKTMLPDSFGDVAPQAGDCGSPEAFGANVTIGNKPLCANQEHDSDDAFRGAVYSVRIERFSGPAP